MLVTSVFLVQNNFYTDVQRRTAVHESVRSVTEMLSGEVRAIPKNGFVSAEYDRLIYRTPLAIGGVCDQSGFQSYVHIPLSGTGFDAGEVAGYAVQDAAGDWTYNSAAWSTILGSQGSGPASACYAAGADTTGATADFYLLNGLATPPTIGRGTAIMLYRETELRSMVSALDPTSFALYRAPYGEALVEFAHGLWGVWFCFRLEGTSLCSFFVNSVDYDKIAEITLYVIGRAPPSTGGGLAYTVYWTIDVPLRNVE
ncbi:MAG: hypothetical protein KAJ42_11315 [Gemmatimonadetes bacterium]|nr:hypothetical protein [Gemmatimonadota bacterium]